MTESDFDVRDVSRSYTMTIVFVDTFWRDAKTVLPNRRARREVLAIQRAALGSPRP